MIGLYEAIKAGGQDVMQEKCCMVHKSELMKNLWNKSMTCSIRGLHYIYDLAVMLKMLQK